MAVLSDTISVLAKRGAPRDAGGARRQGPARGDEAGARRALRMAGRGEPAARLRHHPLRPDLDAASRASTRRADERAPARRGRRASAGTALLRRQRAGDEHAGLRGAAAAPDERRAWACSTWRAAPAPRRSTRPTSCSWRRSPRQVALALDRARLTERQRLQEEQERLRLQAEVEELRTALQRTQIVYRSPPMESLLDARPPRGPHRRHRAHHRRERHRQGAVRARHPRAEPAAATSRSWWSTAAPSPPRCIESELFGHEKGAFTGAQSRQPGRLVQADRGTLLPRRDRRAAARGAEPLLRFVQEKHVTPVGGRAGRTVDVRIIAATNRDLQAGGRGRPLPRRPLPPPERRPPATIPPLRERTDDVLPPGRALLPACTR